MFVIRDKKTGKWPFDGVFSDAARERAREHLKSVGVRLEHLPPFEPPEDAVSAYQRSMYEPYKYTTKDDILREKRKYMEQHLWLKREAGVIYRRPAYVWVFWCCGVSGLFYKGWWIYLIGRGISTSKYFTQSPLFFRILELFPLVERNLFGHSDINKWKAEFVKRYQRGYWGGKPQGKAPIWVEVKEGRIERILGRGQWHKSYEKD